jgi:hypothetical protein
VKSDKIKYSAILLSLMLLTGCFPKDDLVIPLDIDLIEIPYSMYDTQTWFSLQNMSVTSHNAFSDWDLGFESIGTGHHIILNTSKFMHAGNTGSTDFYGITTNICDTMVYDDSGGDLNKTAIGEWADFTEPSNPVYHRQVYIIDLGADNDGVLFGSKKITIDSLVNNTYSIHFSNLDGSDEYHAEVVTDPERSFTLFSFSNGGNVVNAWPAGSSWDLCFTQYSTILYDDNNIATPYLVRGVYINMTGTAAARDTVNSFYDITANDISGYTFSSAQDIIGYDWKEHILYH